jgi:hypothetical protein
MHQLTSGAVHGARYPTTQRRECPIPLSRFYQTRKRTNLHSSQWLQEDDVEQAYTRLAARWLALYLLLLILSPLQAQTAVKLLGRGVVLKQYVQPFYDSPQIMNVLEVDLRNPAVRVDAEVGTGRCTALTPLRDGRLSARPCNGWARWQG